jgi:hypothetical protein
MIMIVARLHDLARTLSSVCARVCHLPMRGSRRLSSGAGGGTSKPLAASSVTATLLPSADLARTPRLLPSGCSRTARLEMDKPSEDHTTAPRPTRPSPVAWGPRSRPRGTAGISPVQPFHVREDWEESEQVEQEGDRRTESFPEPAREDCPLAAFRSSLFVTAT